MSPKQYRKRFKALGFNISTWAKYCGVNRSTINRHLTAEVDPIPRVYFLVIEALENGGLDNPNN